MATMESRKDSDTKRGRRPAESTESEIVNDDRVLMTFQVDEALRTAAMRKAKSSSINLSQFLRQCVHEFTQSDEIGRATQKLQRTVARRALSAVEAEA